MMGQSLKLCQYIVLVYNAARDALRNTAGQCIAGRTAPGIYEFLENFIWPLAESCCLTVKTQNPAGRLSASVLGKLLLKSN
jgi:hypothetical protein